MSSGSTRNSGPPSKVEHRETVRKNCRDEFGDEKCDQNEGWFEQEVYRKEGNDVEVGKDCGWEVKGLDSKEREWMKRVWEMLVRWGEVVEECRVEKDLVGENGGAETLVRSLRCTRRGGLVSQVGYLGKQRGEDLQELVPTIIDRRIHLR